MNYKIATAVAAVVAALAVLIIFAVRSDNDWKAWCQSQGGHVTSDTNVVTVVGANGKPGIGTTTTSFCLTADGRILDVQ